MVKSTAVPAALFLLPSVTAVLKLADLTPEAAMFLFLVDTSALLPLMPSI
jgi:hypothetical protein